MIQSLERAVKILRLVAESGDGIRLCDLARACEMKRNTIFNLADTLVSERLLAKTAAGQYIIGNMILELAGGQKRNSYLLIVEKALRDLHLKYPGAAIFYSELGNTDIIAKLHFEQTYPGKAVYPDGMTLNPYLTVAGLAFFAFSTEERLVSLRAKNPFDYHGLNAWCSMDKFMAQVEIARRKGYAETPQVTPRTEFKVGIPVRARDGGMAGAVTFHLFNANGLNEREILREVMTSVEKISGGEGKF
jgi:IclR family KDG regulon transcriptional repressor